MKKINFNNPILIYLCTILCIAFIIGFIYVINEVVSRLQPENQVLAFGEEETTYVDPILKVYAWELVPDEENIAELKNYRYKFDGVDENPGWLEVEKYRLSEITDMPLRVGQPKTGCYAECGQCLGGYYPDNDSGEAEHCDFCDDGYYIGYSSTTNEFAVFVAECDAELKIEITVQNMNNGYRQGGNFSDSSGLCDFYNHENIRTQGSILVKLHYPTEPLDPDSSKLRGHYKDSGEELWYQTSTERIGEIYPPVGNALKKHNPNAADKMNVDAWKLSTRDVVESSIVFYAYDKTNPEKLIAYAEVRITHRTYWNTFERYLYTYYHLLGINVPDAYGYTEAVLYDYWQADDWS